MKIMAKTSLVLLVFCLLLSPAAGFAGVPSPGEVQVFASRFAYASSIPFLVIGVEEPVTIQIRSTSAPPAYVAGTEQVGEELRIYLAVPAATATVPVYEYVLTSELLLPATTISGSFQLAVYAFLENDPPPGERITTQEIYVGDSTVKILGIRPERPTAKDRIEVLLNREPCEPDSLLPQILSDSVRLRSDSCWRGPSAGYSLLLEPLAAGRWTLDLDGQEIGIQSRYRFDVLPATTLLAQYFEVKVNWRTASGQTGQGQLAQPPSADSALYYFFSPENWELMVKVLDGCALNGHYWVFTAASTDVAYEVRIDRRNSDQELRIENPLGVAAPAVTNIEAFPCDPALQ